MKKQKLAHTIVCQVKGGWGIKVNGQLIGSTHGTPFKSKESAQGGIRLYLSQKDKRFFIDDETDTPSQDNASPISLEIPPKKKNAATDSQNVRHHPPAETFVLDYIGHSPAESHALPGMSGNDFREVFQTYQVIVDKFSHDQIYCLNALLHRYDIALDMNELLEKERIRNAGYDHRTSWKYQTGSPQPAQLVEVEAERDELEELEELDDTHSVRCE